MKISRAAQRSLSGLAYEVDLIMIHIQPSPICFCL